jgi:hypothetical protein
MHAIPLERRGLRANVEATVSEFERKMDNSKFKMQLPRDKAEGSELRLFMINLSKNERLKTQKMDECILFSHA